MPRDATCSTARALHVTSHEIPTCTWQIVGTDMFVINKESYLIVSDYYSKFPFVYAIPCPVNCAAVISKMKSLFAEQGVLQRVVSDNGGRFSSDAFRKFADQLCFDHVTSSPHYPQSNGYIERHIQTVKRTLKKVGPRSDTQVALLVLTATPIDSRLPSPAELLYGRRVVSNLPIAISNASGSRCAIRARLDERQASANEHHDAREVMDLSVLSRGQIVRTRHPDTHRWDPAHIVNACPQPRSYEVESTSGRILRRNRRDIRETTKQLNNTCCYTLTTTTTLGAMSTPSVLRQLHPTLPSTNETHRLHSDIQQFVLWSQFAPALVELSVLHHDSPCDIYK